MKTITLPALLPLLLACGGAAPAPSHAHPHSHGHSHGAQDGDRTTEAFRAHHAEIRTKLDEVKRTLPKGVTIETFYDRTERVDRTIRTVALNLV